MSTETIEQLDIEGALAPFEDTDDGKEHFTHIVNPPSNPHIWEPGMSAKDIVSLARMLGEEIVALCGYRWVPKRNPENHPVCKQCLDIAEQIMRS